MKTMMKKVFGMMVVTLLMGLFAACGSPKSDEGSEAILPTEINFGVMQIPNDETLAISEGLFDKYFTEKGIKCNFINFDSGSDVIAALASKSIDFGVIGSSPATIALALGLDVEMIWIHEVLGEIESLAVREGSRIDSVEDLIGKKIATPVASTAHYSLLNGLKNAGIADKVEILDMQPLSIVAAWDRGDIDATYVWQPALGDILGKNGKIMFSSADVAAQGAVTSNVEVVSKKFSEKYPDLVASYIACMVEAGDIYRENPENVSEVMAKALEITPEEALTQMNGSIWLTLDEALSKNYFGTSEDKGKLAKIMKETGEFLKEQKSIEEVPSQDAFNAYVNSMYLEKAKTLLNK